MLSAPFLKRYKRTASQLGMTSALALISEMQDNICIIPMLLMQMPPLKERDMNGSNNFTLRQ